MNNIVMKGFDGDEECYAVKVKADSGHCNTIVEVEATETIKKEYNRQKNKFTKRRTWNNGRRNNG